MRKKQGKIKKVILLNPKPRESKVITTVQITTEQKDSMKRHIVGLVNIMDNIGALSPQCPVCFKERGWLRGCACEKGEM